MITICVATATRAEYGLLKPLMGMIQNHPNWILKILVTGAHLSPEFGYTYHHIEADGFTIDAKVEMLMSSDTDSGIVKSMGVGMIGFSDAFTLLKPDLLIILGDRYESLAIATAASVFKFPIAHLHGGELTLGAYDDAFRHAITKLSHIHFTASDVYRRRVIQMGEAPETVFNTGAIGLDNMRTISFMTKEELEMDLGIFFKSKLLLVTFHPETLSNITIQEQAEGLFDALDAVEHATIIITKANADTGGRVINDLIDQFAAKRQEIVCVSTSLGQRRYLSVMKIASAVIGNSSSGLIEAPYFKVPTVNIGGRQDGRLRTSSIIDCGFGKENIFNAIERAFSPSFREDISSDMSMPYGNGHASEKIINILEQEEFRHRRIKRFYDIDSE